jgi:hypothetical protein
MSAWTRASIAFTDNKGRIAKVLICVLAAAVDPSGGAVDAIRTAWVTISACFSQRAETGGTAGGSGAAGSGETGTVEDRLVATFASPDGSTTMFEVPGPKASLFLPDSVEVDPTNAAFNTWKAYVIANFKSQYGLGLAFVKAKRSSKKQMKI